MQIPNWAHDLHNTGGFTTDEMGNFVAINGYGYHHNLPVTILFRSFWGVVRGCANGEPYEGIFTRPVSVGET